jgi:hypothetical protein
MGLIDVLTSIFPLIMLGIMLARRTVVYWRYLQMKKPMSILSNGK